MGVPVLRAGVWKYGAGEVESRLAEAQRDIAGLVALGRAANMAVALQNVAGENVGASVWDFHTIIRSMDARYVGYDFDPGYAMQEGGVGGWATALRLALPRLKMVTLRDFYWSRQPEGGWKPAPCPLGEGMVDWPKFFAALARVKFTGPVTIHQEYKPQNELSAIRRDIAFAKKQLAAAYGG
jgi:sugar phosphate isomerase/epimerase